MYPLKERNIPDVELVERIRSGDQNAYYILFDRYWDLLYAMSQSLLKNADLSKDILQDVWLSLWERRQQVENQNIRAYLLQAVKFRVYKELRDGKLHVEHEEYLTNLPASHSTEGVLDHKELQTQINKWVEELPHKCGEVFKLSRFEHLSNSEIAEKLSISSRTVETHISNALKFLREKRELLTVILMLSNQG